MEFLYLEFSDTRGHEEKICV